VTAPLVLGAPFPGWCLALDEVPDAVFAQGLAGDGVAIDPTAATLVAPCDGEIVAMKGARHAVTLRTAVGIELLVHVGIDTVALAGEGFELLVEPGARVRAGDALLRFDLDFVARRVPSLVSPMVLPSGGTVVRRTTGRTVHAGEPVMEVIAAAGAAAQALGPEERRELVMAFDHGLHVRPAAQVVAALRPFAADVRLELRGRSASARSTVSMMALGAQRGDVVHAIARGADAGPALDALESLLPRRRDTVPAAREVAAPVRGRIEGVVASAGLVLGTVAHWVQPAPPVVERGAGEPGERAALQGALARVRARLEGEAQAARGSGRALLQAHAELASDPELGNRAEELLRQGKSAAFAWRGASRAVAESLARLDDTRMRERASDLRDLEGQVLRALSGEVESRPPVPPGSVIVADDLPPSALLGSPPGLITGICTAQGGATSHLAILAAAAGIPALAAAGPRVLAIAPGTRVVLDADHGWLDVDPTDAEIEVVKRELARREGERASAAAAAREPASTRDGVRVRVYANLGAMDEVAGAIERGAEGCGLLRTEFLYLERAQAPGEDEQAEEYARIATALGGRPLTIRTLDPGGDKPLGYLPLPPEENPALGMRGVRASLLRPELLRTQLRAILRAGAPRQCRILVPMVTDAEELLAVRAMAEECARELGTTLAPVGAMIETPASALLADALARSADFLSIGSNDLSQYTLAMDRAHPELARRLDALHPAVLRLIALVADACQAHGRAVSLCGALGSDAQALPVLVGLGIHEISAAPSAIPRLKHVARMLDAEACRALARQALEAPSAAEVRALCDRALAAAASTPPGLVASVSA